MLLLHGGASLRRDIVSVQLLQKSSSVNNILCQKLQAVLSDLLRRQIWNNASFLGN